MYIENINLSANNSITISISDKNDNSYSDDKKIILWVDTNFFLKLVESLGENIFENFNDYFVQKQ